MTNEMQPRYEDVLKSIGHVITTPRERDAIHFAIAPVIAGQRLSPGQPVVVKNNIIWSGYFPEPDGVVDPFLKGDVLPGQMCWMLLNPGSVTSLRHDWTHPAFQPKGE